MIATLIHEAAVTTRIEQNQKKIPSSHSHRAAQSCGKKAMLSACSDTSDELCIKRRGPLAFQPPSTDMVKPTEVASHGPTGGHAATPHHTLPCLKMKLLAAQIINLTHKGETRSTHVHKVVRWRLLLQDQALELQPWQQYQYDKTYRCRHQVSAWSTGRTSINSSDAGS